jgi:hypothetical protein
VLAVGARDRSTGADWVCYTVDEVALRHGAGVDPETTDPTGRTRPSRGANRRVTAGAGSPSSP